jgi:hypothetical protein
MHLSCVKRFLSQWYVWRKSCTYLALTLTLSTNGPKRDSTWPTSPCSSIRCVQNDIQAFSTLGANCAPILHQDYDYLQTDWSELPLEPRHLGVLSGVSKTIFEPMRCLAQNRAPIMQRHLHCLQMDRNEILHDPRHLGVPSGVLKTLSKPMVCLAQTMHLSYIKISTISKRTESSFHMSLIT